MTTEPQPTPERAYGHDETDRFGTLAEATRTDDGLVEFRVVVVDKRNTVPTRPVSRDTPEEAA